MRASSPLASVSVDAAGSTADGSCWPCHPGRSRRCRARVPRCRGCLCAGLGGHGHRPLRRSSRARSHRVRTDRRRRCPGPLGRALLRRNDQTPVPPRPSRPARSAATGRLYSHADTTIAECDVKRPRVQGVAYGKAQVVEQAIEMSAAIVLVGAVHFGTAPFAHSTIRPQCRRGSSGILGLRRARCRTRGGSRGDGTWWSCCSATPEPSTCRRAGRAGSPPSGDSSP